MKTRTIAPPPFSLNHSTNSDAEDRTFDQQFASPNYTVSPEVLASREQIASPNCLSSPRNLTSAELLTKTKSLVTQERAITLALIEHLEECQSRMLYAELGYSSLWEFATRELGLSEGAAQRRIQAMRLVQDVPAAKIALHSGELSLSNAAKVQSFRQSEKKQGRKHDAAQLVAKVTDLSQRDCERKLLEISPQSLPQERERQVSARGDREVRVLVTAKLYEKIQRLQGLLAHALPDAPGYADLLERLVDQELARLERKHGLTLDPEQAATAAAAVTETPPSGKRCHVPAPIQRAVWARSGGRCEWVAKSSGRRCEARHRMQRDHIVALAHGGSNELENFRLLCRSHNQFAASLAGLRQPKGGDRVA